MPPPPPQVRILIPSLINMAKGCGTLELQDLSKYLVNFLSFSPISGMCVLKLHLWETTTFGYLFLCLHIAFVKPFDYPTRLGALITWNNKHFVRLNLINHFVGFIPCQFACNSTFRNLVFRWESCKGSVWESVKKSSRVHT